ncbi:MAG TPA: hypothetical protein VFC23_13165 [Thermoanaerobaculia bacterium]|nr:hypothetical protein [Thermoanaerobaculia bacterium]
MTSVWSAERAARADTLRARALAPIVVVAGSAGGILAAKLASQRQPMTVVVFALALVPLALWRWPQAAVLGLLAGTVMVEQFQYTVGTKPGVFTDKIPLFQSLSKGSGITPMEMLLVLMVVIWLMKGALEHSLGLPRSTLSRTMVVYLGLVVLGFAIGLAHGGKIKTAGWEVRPWFYMALAYVLAYSFLKTASAVKAIMWTLVLGSGFKAIQGVMMFLSVRHWQPRPEEILAHEEAFFFGLFLILCIGLWVFRIKGRLRAVATLLLPAVLLADLVNSRRNAWAIVGTTLITFFVMAYASLPERRRALRRFGVVVLVVSAVYFPLFWNKSGTLGQPARALHSQISPDARDLQSNRYRTLENANLAINIRQAYSIGRGFGVPINYVIPIVDISNVDAAISFLPHNGILWIWMRIGIEGEIVFLAMLAAAVMVACRLTKVRDPELILLGVLTVCALVAYVVQGYNDMGFFWFRIALCLGILLGAVEASLRRVADQVALPAVAR